MKKIVVIIIFLCTSSFIIFSIGKIENQNIIISNKAGPTNSKSQLAIMLESDKVGEYIISDAKTWPTDGYVFNADLSKCENNGTLTWNSENKTVELNANNSDKCYVYFDKATPLSINNIEVHKELGLLRFTVQTSGGIGTLNYFYEGYIKNINGNVNLNGTEATIENNTYTFNNINNCDLYNITVIVRDEQNNTQTYTLNNIEPVGYDTCNLNPSE